MKTNLLPLFTLLLLAACEAESNSSGMDATPIRFASGVALQTKAGAVEGRVLPEGSRIGIVAWSQKVADGEEGDAILVMDNLPGTAEADGALSYNPVKYYEPGFVYRFYACHPYDAAVSAFETEGGPSLPVELKTDAILQHDYMWATPLRVTPEADPPTGARKFTFHHALSRIRVQVRNESGSAQRLGYVEVEAPSVGTFSLRNGEWSNMDTAEVKGYKRFSLYHPTIPEVLPKDSCWVVPGSLLLLPVTDVTLLTFRVKIGDEEFQIPPTTPAGGWQAGLSYLYTVWYGATGIVFKGTVAPWDEVPGGNITPDEE